MARFGASSTVTAASVAATSSAARRGYPNLDDREARRRTRESFSGFVESKGWADLADQPRLRVRKYVGEEAAVVDLAGRRALVRSMLPLRSGRGEDKKPVDTDLSLRDGRPRPVQPLAEYSVAASTQDGSLVDFPNSGVKVQLDGAVRDKRGAREANSRIYPNAYLDADALVKSLPNAAQIAISVRGPRAPQTYSLALTMRDGDRLLSTSPQARGARKGPDGGAVVLRDGQPAVTVSAPVAADAAGKALPVRTTISGSRLEYRLNHRDSSVAYPALLDPFVAEDQRYWFGQAPPGAPQTPTPSSPPDFNGWAFDSAGLFGGIAGNGAFGRGLNIFTNGNITYPSSGAIGSWIYQAPYVPAFEADGAKIVKADFGYTAHVRSQGAVTNQAASSMLQSIFNRQQGRPENAFWRSADPNSAYTGYTQPFGAIFSNSEGIVGNKATYPYRVHCLTVCGTGSTPANEALGSPGNQARLGMFQAAGRPSRLAGGVFMGSSLIFLTEQAAPRITTSGAPPPTTWTKNAFTLNSTVNDYGLGPRQASISAPGATGTLPTATQGSPCTGAGVGPPQGGTPGSANQGDRNHRCTAPLALQTPSSALADGSYNVTASATDILGNSGSATVPVKLDRAPPTVSLTGSLKDRAGGYAKDGDSVRITATDPHSGARTLTVKLDGQDITGSPATCSTDGCTTTVDYTLDARKLSEGTHTITVNASDLVGNPAPAQQLIFKVDTTPPTILPSGELWANDEATLGDSGYELHLEGSDGTIPWPGSGIKTLSVRIDGQQVAAFPAAADCPPDNCTAEADWAFDTSTVAPGVRLVEVVATDGVGLESTAALSVDVQPTPNLPARVTTAAAASTLRIDGANGSLLGLGGDRLGSAVAVIGDQNDDGVDDYLVGAPDRTAGAGAAYVIFGGQTGSIDTSSLTAAQGYAINGGALERAGTALAAAGDVNGDDVTDFLIGAPGTPVLGTQLLPGKVYVVFGGRCRSFNLGDIASCGFAVSGPPLGLDIGSTLPGFGSVLGGVGPNSGPAGADVNGDDLDDVLIGNARADNANRTNSGSAYLIYGKTDNAAVDAASDAALGPRGFRIDGAGGEDHAGSGVAIVDDIDSDELADLVIGTPGTEVNDPEPPNTLRTDSGGAVLLFGKTDDNNVDLANLGDRGNPILGAANTRIGTTVAALGDIDGDTTPDYALGGRGAAVVLGRGPDDEEGDVPVDLGVPDELAYRSTAPANAGDDAIVSALGDSNGDGRPDIAVSYPSLGNVFALLTQDTMRTILRDNASPDTLPGQQATRVTPSAANDANGASMSGSSQADESGTLIVGAPRASNNARTISGSAYVVTQPGAPQAAAAAAGASRCAPRAGYQYYFPARSEADKFTYWNCRQTVGRSSRQTGKDESPRRARCGGLSARRCKRTSVVRVFTSFRRQPKNINPRAVAMTQLASKQLADTNLPPATPDGKQHMELVGTTPPTGTAPQNPAIPQAEYAWPIRDSVGKTIGYIRQVPMRPANGPDPGVRPNTFRLWNDQTLPGGQKQFLGTTGLRTGADPTNPDIPAPQNPVVEMQGQPCAARTIALRTQTAIVYFRGDPNSGGGTNSTEDGNPVSIRGLLAIDAFAPASFKIRGLELRNEDAVQAFFAKCDKPSRSLPSADQDVMRYTAPAFAFPSASDPYPDRYQSENVTRRKGAPSAGGDTNLCTEQFDRAATDKFCSAAYANYYFPLPAPLNTEVQNLKINATSGQFTISTDLVPPTGALETTAPIPFNASVDTVRQRLGTAGVGQEILVSGQPSNYTLTYTLNSRRRDIPEITVNPAPPGVPPLSGAPSGTQFAVTTLVQGGSPKPTYPPLAVLPASTTGVNGGGITRGVLVTSSRVNVRLIDRFSYLDPNLPCDQPEIATWNLVKLSTVDETGAAPGRSEADRRLARKNRGIYLWAPRRIGDGTTPAVPMPRLSPAIHACTATTPPP